MRELTYAEALAEGLAEILEADDRVVLFGAGMGAPAGRLIRERYADRFTNPPISEIGYCGIAIGAAMAGLRPIVAISTATFSFEAFPQILNEAAPAHYGSDGQINVPIVFHMLTGIRGAGGFQHSGSPQSMFWNTPGLEVVAPGAPADAKGLLKTAVLRSPNPTVFIDHRHLHNIRGPVPDGNSEVPFGVAEVKRAGNDVTIVAVSIMVPRALEAAETLARDHGISAEVVDPRTLVPLDKATILASVAKTGRVVVADESPKSCGITAELAAIIAEEGFDSLKAPIKRVAIPDVPIPYSKAQEDAVTPGPDDVVAAARALIER